VAAGRPVVATRFPHAVELLADGAGVTVPHRNPLAMANALREVLTHPGRAEAMTAVAQRLGAELSWPAVAERYVGLGRTLVAERRRAPGATARLGGR